MYYRGAVSNVANEKDAKVSASASGVKIKSVLAPGHTQTIYHQEHLASAVFYKIKQQGDLTIWPFNRAII
jgi:hypothetical protein